MDLGLALAGLVVGAVVGMTGMGGGALMTPVLVLFFGVQPLAAVSSDLVASAVMKPVGGVVHLRRGTVNLELVKWLVIGSVPAAFVGVLVLRWLGDGESVQQVVKVSLGIALLRRGGLPDREGVRPTGRTSAAPCHAAFVRKRRPARPDVVVRPLLDRARRCRRRSHRRHDVGRLRLV